VIVRFTTSSSQTSWYSEIARAPAAVSGAKITARNARPHHIERRDRLVHTLRRVTNFVIVGEEGRAPPGARGDLGRARECRNASRKRGDGENGSAPSERCITTRAFASASRAS